jgi:hypothetical protein
MAYGCCTGRQDIVHRLAGRYDNPMPVHYISKSESTNLASELLVGALAMFTIRAETYTFCFYGK